MTYVSYKTDQFVQSVSFVNFKTEGRLRSTNIRIIFFLMMVTQVPMTQESNDTNHNQHQRPVECSRKIRISMKMKSAPLQMSKD